MTAEGDFVIADRGIQTLCSSALQHLQGLTARPSRMLPLLVFRTSTRGAWRPARMGTATSSTGPPTEFSVVLQPLRQDGCDIVAGDSRGSDDMQFNP